MSTPESDTSLMGGGHEFKTTRWNLVQTARDGPALDALLRIYWKPLYFFVRQHGHDNETSKDLVQGFLTSFLEHSGFEKADPGRGRFRTFLLASLENYIRDQARAASSQKRGGGKTLLSLDFDRGEREFARESRREESPTTVLNRAWARSLLEQSISELSGEPAHLDAFRRYQAGVDLKTIAAETGLTESAAQSAIHRLKGRLKDIIVGHIRESVSTPEDLRAEVAEFMALLA